jgi:hypothetical protein
LMPQELLFDTKAQFPAIPHCGNRGVAIISVVAVSPTFFPANLKFSAR